MSLIFEIIIVLISAIIGFIVIIRTLFNYRYQKELWSTFNDVARRFGLKVRNSSTIASNYPDIYGEIDGRKVYLHPAKKQRGKRSRPSKTIFGVEHGVKVEESVIITRSGTDTKKEELVELEVDTLTKYKLSVKSESKLNEKLLNDVIDNDVARKINDLIEESVEDFRALIIESGLLMFSTFGFEDDEDTINKNIEQLYEISINLENNLGEIEDIYNERFSQLEGMNYATPIKYVIDISLTLMGVIIMYFSLKDVSFIYLNIGIVILLVAAVRMYSLTSLIFKGRRG